MRGVRRAASGGGIETAVRWKKLHVWPDKSDPRLVLSRSSGLRAWRDTRQRAAGGRRESRCLFYLERGQQAWRWCAVGEASRVVEKKRERQKDEEVVGKGGRLLGCLKEADEEGAVQQDRACCAWCYFWRQIGGDGQDRKEARGNRRANKTSREAAVRPATEGTASLPLGGVAHDTLEATKQERGPGRPGKRRSDGHLHVDEQNHRHSEA